MMRFLRKGDRYVLNKPLIKYSDPSFYGFKCLIQSFLGKFYHQFSCNVQESRASGITGYGAQLLAALAHAIQVLRTVYKHKRSNVDTCLTLERHMNDTTNCVKDGVEDERKRLRHDVRSDGSKGNQQAGSKLSLSMTSVSSFNTLLIHCYYFTHTWLILRPYTKSASTRVTGWFGIASRLGRTLVHTCSTVVRVLFECCSSATRTTLEAHPKSTRSRVEQVSNTTRRAVEGQSKRTRTVVEALSKDNRSITVKKEKQSYLAKTIKWLSEGKGLGNDLFVNRLILRAFCSLSEKVSRKVGSMVGKIKRSSQNGLNEVNGFLTGTKLSQCNSSIFGTSGDSDKGGALFTHTWGILRPYTKVSKGTDEVGIKRGYSRDIVLLVQQLRRMLGFLKEYFRSAMDSLCHYVSNNSRISRLGLLTIFCVLFGFASVVEAQAQEPRQGGATGFDVVSDTVIRGHKIVPYKNELVIKRLEENTSYDLKKFPMVVYDIDRTLVDGVAIGGRIPDELWNVPLKIVNGEGEIKNVRLSEFAADQILILDFWTTWCKPCIESVIKWEAISAKAPDRVKVVNVLLDFEYKAPLFLAKRDWQSPTAIGMSAYLLNAYFFTSETFGKIVWIQSGKLQSITTASQLSEQELEDVVMGRLDFPESLKEGTYGLNLSKS